MGCGASSQKSIAGATSATRDASQTKNHRHRSLFIGCDYRGTSDAVFDGTVGGNDARTLVKAVGSAGFDMKDRAIMTEDALEPESIPTKANMERAMRWLVEGAGAGDALLLAFSGRPAPDNSGILPTDHESNGSISHSDLNAILVAPLPAGVRLTVFLCCAGPRTSAPLMMPQQFVREEAHAFVEPKNGKSVNWSPGPEQRKLNNAGFREAPHGTHTSAQVVVFHAGEESEAIKPQFVAQFSHPWKQTSKYGPVGSRFANAVAQVVYNNTVEGKPGLGGMGTGAFVERGCENLRKRELAGGVFLAASAPIEMHVPFKFIPTNTFSQDSEVEPTVGEGAGFTAITPGPSSGQTRAVLIGIDYLDTPECRDERIGRSDLHCIARILSAMGADLTFRRVLIDDEAFPDAVEAPTRNNILDALSWLSRDVRAGDSLFLFFSGKCNDDGDMLPSDYEDDVVLAQEMRMLLVDPLPKGVTLTAFFACGSKNPLRLEHEFKIEKGMNFIPPRGAESSWRPEQSIRDKNELAFSAAKPRGTETDAKVLVFTASDGAEDPIAIGVFGHAFRGDDDQGTAIVHGIGQLVYNDTKGGRTLGCALGEFVQRTQNNLKMRKVPGTLTLYIDAPCDPHQPLSVHASGVPEPPRRVPTKAVKKLDRAANSTASLKSVKSSRLKRDASTRNMGSQENVDTQSQGSSGGSSGSSTAAENSVHAISSFRAGGRGRKRSKVNQTQNDHAVPKSTAENVSDPLALNDAEASMLAELGEDAAAESVRSEGTEIQIIPSFGVSSEEEFKKVRPQSDGKMRSLFIGMTYNNCPKAAPNPAGPYDCLTMMETLETLGFDTTDFRFLTDDLSIPVRTGQPTKRNVLEAFTWMVNTTKPGDDLVLYFSGLGSQHHDDGNDESDGKDEYMRLDDGEELCDDDIFDALIAKLPGGSRLTIFFECSHAGTMSDLPWEYVWHPTDDFAIPTSASDDFSSAINRKRKKANSAWKESSLKKCAANVMCFAASSDAEGMHYVDISNIKHPWKFHHIGGALTHGFASEVIRGTRRTNDGQLHVTVGNLMNALQHYLMTPKEAYINEVVLTASTAFDLRQPFSIFGALPSAPQS